MDIMYDTERSRKCVREKVSQKVPQKVSQENCPKQVTQENLPKKCLKQRTSENIHSATHISDANLQLQQEFFKYQTPSLINQKEKDYVKWHECSK